MDTLYEIIKYGWTYKITADPDNEDTWFEIAHDHRLQNPNYLSKLYAINDNSVDALLNQYIYASHPSQFNDLFDCHEDLIEFDDKDAVRHFVKKYASDRFSDEQIENAIINDFKRISDFAKRNLREMLYQRLGIFSMTANPYNIVMWSYYTHHKGFFIEFDVSKFPFKFHGPFPVNYQKDLKPISISEHHLFVAALLQTNLKYIDWKHEDEWRILVESNERMYSPSFEELRKLGGHNRKFNYPIEAIKAVGFGNRFFPPEELVIVSDKIMKVTLKEDILRKQKILNFLISNNIETCFSHRDGLMKIYYGGMVIEKISDTEYIFNVQKWADKNKK